MRGDDLDLPLRPGRCPDSAGAVETEHGRSYNVVAGNSAGSLLLFPTHPSSVTTLKEMVLV